MRSPAKDGICIASVTQDGINQSAHGVNSYIFPYPRNSRKLPIPSSKINPYRLIIILQLVVLGFFSNIEFFILSKMYTRCG